MAPGGGSRGAWHPPGSQRTWNKSWPPLLLTWRVEFRGPRVNREKTHQKWRKKPRSSPESEDSPASLWQEREGSTRGRKLRIGEAAPGWRQVGKEEGGERKEETNWQCERLVWLKGARPTHCRAQDGGPGERQHEPRPLYLLENEGFHSSDEGHKRMKHKRSRSSKPQGENPPYHTPARGWGEAGSQLPATTAPSASEAH